MNTSNIYLSTSSISLLIQLISAHLIGTIFAYTVYINLSSLGDGYLPEGFEGFNAEMNSTLLVHGVYGYLGAFLPGFLAPMALGLIVAIVTWHAFRDIYTEINSKLFWSCNLLPHFLVWSGSSSKEQIVIICGIIVIDFSAKRSFADRGLNLSLLFVFISLWIIYYIRPNYFIIYLIIFTTSLFAPSLHKIVINRFSVGVWVLTFSLVIMGLTFVGFYDEKFINEDVVDFMKAVEISFLSYEAGSNRTSIQWNDVSDFICNSFWGIPQGFIGPTLIEIISKPIQIPVFLEGLVYLYIMGYLFVGLFKLADASPVLRVHILPYLFVALVIVFISYPYLIFNPGSGLRYKQSMHPVLIFYPLLILAYARANNLMKTDAKTVPMAGPDLARM